MKGEIELLFGSQRSAPNLDDAVKTLLSHLEIRAPEGCVYSSHSCRIGAYTESLLFPQVSFDILLAQFNWVSVDMPKVYFDHRMVLSWEVQLFTSKPAEFEKYQPNDVALQTANC